MSVKWVARAVVSRQNDYVKQNLIIKEKLDYYAKSQRGKNTSVIHDTLPLIQLFLNISNSEAMLIHSEWNSGELRIWWINVTVLRYNRRSEHKEVAWREFVVIGASVTAQAAYNGVILKVPQTSLYSATTVHWLTHKCTHTHTGRERGGEKERERERERERETETERQRDRQTGRETETDRVGDESSNEKSDTPPSSTRTIGQEAALVARRLFIRAKGSLFCPEETATQESTTLQTNKRRGRLIYEPCTSWLKDGGTRLTNCKNSSIIRRQNHQAAICRRWNTSGYGSLNQGDTSCCFVYLPFE